MGHFFPGHWYVKAQRLRHALVERIDAALEGVDALLCATLRAPAPAVGAARVRIGEREYALHTAVTNLTLPFNLAGLPAASIPWTLSTDGAADLRAGRRRARRGLAHARDRAAPRARLAVAQAQAGAHLGRAACWPSTSS
jgi:hypothetical protein